jgi:hypothetical protein
LSALAARPRVPPHWHSGTAALGHAAALITLDTLSGTASNHSGRKMRPCCHEEFDAGKLYMICLELQQNS